MDIKVLGSGCANCKKLEALVREVAAEKNVEASIDKVTDFKEIASYGIVSTPGLVVDGEVKSAGRIPSRAEIAAWISPAS